LLNYTYKGLNAVGHDGGFFGFKTSMNRFPDQRFTVICLCNSRNAPMDTFADQVTDIYLANEFKSSPAPARTPTPLAEEFPQLSATELQRFAGVYWNPVTEGLWMLTIKEGKLVDPGGGGSVLIPIGPNRFRVSGQSIELLFETPRAGGRPIQMIKIVGGGKPQTYKAVNRVTPSMRQLHEYVGTYYSDELESKYEFAIQDGLLILRRKKAKAIQLFATFAENFWNDNFGYVRFTRDDHHRINGFLLTSGWIRRLRFAKS